MKIVELIQLLESFASPELQEDYDNSGLITGNPEEECRAVLLSLDCTEEIVQEAIRKNANFIITHHPLIFRPVRRISTETESGRTLLTAIRSGITIYAIHTNLDNIRDGVCAAMADRIGLVNRNILSPKPGLPAVGSGMIGDLENPLSEAVFLLRLKRQFGLRVIRHTNLTGRTVKSVALCGGAGSFLITNALRAGADFFVSADIKYHEFFQAEGRMVIADIGHFESEQFTVDLLHDLILEKFPNFAVLKPEILTNPVQYYI